MWFPRWDSGALEKNIKEKLRKSKKVWTLVNNQCTRIMADAIYSGDGVVVVDTVLSLEFFYKSKSFLKLKVYF